MKNKLTIIGLLMTLAATSLACGKGKGRKSGLSNLNALHSEEWEGTWLPNHEPIGSPTRASMEALVPNDYVMLALVPRQQVPVGSLKPKAITEIGTLDFEFLESFFEPTYPGNVQPKTRRSSANSNLKAFIYTDSTLPNQAFILAERASKISEWLHQTTPILVRSNPIQFCSQLKSPPAPGYSYTKWLLHMPCLTKPITVNCNWQGRCEGAVIIPCPGRPDSVHWFKEPLSFFTERQPKSECAMTSTDYTATQNRQNERRAIAIRIRGPNNALINTKL